MKKIIIGARGSKLSLAYVAKVKSLILEKNLDLGKNNIFFKAIKTSGDIFFDKKLSEIGGKNLFCKEIEENLVEEKIDIAVHSLKDMEAQENESLIVGAYIERNDPRDCFISIKYNNLKELTKDSIVGSSSSRRELQLKLINQNIFVSNIRGNIDTRIKKLEEGKIDVIILAAAGVKSLNLEKKIKKIFSIEEILPAAGQGIIAVQCRKNDNYTKSILNKINNYEANLCANAERQVLRVIRGDCDTAVGVFANLENNYLKLRAQLFSDDKKKNFNYEISGPKENVLNIGKKVGEKLLELAGKEFKKK
jgi:hydroxymethylbilane synthase